MTGPNRLLSPPYCGSGRNTCGRDAAYGNVLPLPRDTKVCWLKYENNRTLSGSGLKWGNCTFQSSCMENICNWGKEKHVWKFTASRWAPFSQEVSYIGCTMADIPNPGEYWWGEEKSWGLWVFHLVKTKFLDSSVRLTAWEAPAWGIEEVVPKCLKFYCSHVSLWLRFSLILWGGQMRKTAQIWVLGPLVAMLSAWVGLEEM